MGSFNSTRFAFTTSFPTLVVLVLGVVSASVGGSAFANPSAPEPQCRRGSSPGAQQACGYQCQVGGDGIADCADTADGVCRVGGNGRVVCSRLAHLPARLRQESRTKPECRVGGNGAVACGYACRVGGNGVAVCAGGPNGVCATGGDGQVVCHDGISDAGRRHGRGRRNDMASRGEAPSCLVQGNGQQVCGFNCVRGGDGVVACAQRAADICAVGGNGRAVCSVGLFSATKGAKPECRRGGNGEVACGFACRVGGDGRAACANSEDGTCVVGGDGGVVCSVRPGRGTR